ncbi:MAG: hypothetical protein KAI71_00895 [Candidatus Pacebacteria bacterium]|nr:hypothetical protein [Candidatus Paceibacterota bacterium]
MFNNKKDKKIIELDIKFNLDTIDKWINSACKTNNYADKIESIKQVEQDWCDAFIVSYCIDVLPFGKNSDYYFHREKNIFSNSINGSDLFDNMSPASKDIKVFTKNRGIEGVEWRIDKDGLMVAVNRKLMLWVPVVKFAELQIHGKIIINNLNLKNANLYTDEQKIKIPIECEDSTRNQPKKFIEVLEQTTKYSAGYRNSFCSVLASLTSDILYWR